MSRPYLALVLVSLSAPAQAQVLPGDLLLNSFLSPDALVHFSPDGTVVQATGAGTGELWEGAAILPNGNWLTTRRSPVSGVNIFDSVTGAEIASWDFPGFKTAGDVDVFSDGTIAVVDQNGKVWRFDTDGNVIAKWKVSQHPFGILVDDKDHVWTGDVENFLLWHTDDKGNKFSQFNAGGRPGDVTVARDGTLFIITYGSGWVLHYTRGGKFLGSFKATGTVAAAAIAMGPDETLWASSAVETQLRNFDQAGNLLGSFDVGPATWPMFLTVPVVGWDIGSNYCGPAIPNSTGQPAVISAFGKPTALQNLLTLTASQLPQQVFGYFMNSNVLGFTPLPPGSSGNLCLGGGIGRHVKQVASSGSAGVIVIDVDLTKLPRPNGTHSVTAGETWYFQCWFRDDQGGPTSNFTDGIEVAFQ